MFCHIAPTAFLSLTEGRPEHLTLAHLVETDQVYADFYREESQYGSTIIMDNSAFEKFKAGLPMYDSNKLIEMGRRCDADYIAMSDYPDQPSQLTIDSATQLAPQLRDAGFGTFFIPQSRIGEIDELIECFLWAAESDDVDYIGYSILAIPNAYGVEKNNKLQRYVSRFHFLNRLRQTDFFEKARHKKHHFLGMVDGPAEIELIKSIMPYPLDTWDSSAAVWAGLNGIEFDDSPSRLLNGKFEKEVDFAFKPDVSVLKDVKKMATNNMYTIDTLWWTPKHSVHWT